MRRYIFILLGIVCLCIIGCTGKHTELLLHQADSLLLVQPDSALALLERIPHERGALSRKNAARYALLWAQATDKCFQSLLPCDSLLDVALRYYKDANPNRALALLYKGRLEDEVGRPDEAVRLLQEAHIIMKAYPEDMETRRHILSSLGNIYSFSANYEASIPLYRELYDCCVTDVDKAIALDNIASYYSVKELQDSTFIIQRKALAYAFASKDSFMIAVNLLSMSLNYDDFFEDSDSALHYARLALQWSPTDRPKGNYYYNIGSLLAEDKTRQDSALFYLHKSQMDSTFQGRFLCFLDMADIAENQKNYQASNRYLRQYIAYADSLIFSEQSTPISRLIHEYQTKIRVREEQLRGQRIWWGSMGVGAVLLLGIIGAFLYRLNKKKREQQYYRQQLRQTREKMRILQTTIDNNEVVLSLLRQEQRQKNQEIGKLEETICNFQKEKSALQAWTFAQSAVYKKVQSLRKRWVGGSKEQKVLNHVEQQKLREVVQSIYGDQIQEWKECYPRLTEDDILLLCLQEADFDSQSIAICFGYGDTHAINQRKLRNKERMKASKMQV